MVLDQAIGRGVRPSRVADNGDGNVRVGGRRRPAGVVDDVQDATGAVRGIEKHRQQIVQTSRWQAGGDLKRVRGEDLDALIEEAVATHAVTAEAGHLAANLEGGPAV